MQERHTNGKKRQNLSKRDALMARRDKIKEREAYKWQGKTKIKKERRINGKKRKN